MSLKEIKARKEPAGHLDLIIDAQAPAPANTISFNADGKVVGSLDLGVDPITFTGNADEAAIVFFDSFIRLYDQRYKELQEQVDKLKIDFIGAKSYGNSYFMQLKAAEGKVKELQAKLKLQEIENHTKHMTIWKLQAQVDHIVGVLEQTLPAIPDNGNLALKQVAQNAIDYHKSLSEQTT